MEEKTVQSEKTTENSVPVGSSLNPVEETKLARAYSVLDGEALMEISSKDTCLKECGDGITHSASPYRRGSHEHDQSHSALSSGDCKGLFEEISGEEQTVLTVNEIEKDMLDISFENLEDHSSFSIQAHFEKANDNSVLSGSQKMMLWSRRVEDPLWQMLIKLVRDIHVRIGCYANYLRYANWIDEPNDDTINNSN